MLPSAPRGLARFAPKDVATRTDHPHEPGRPSNAASTGVSRLPWT